MDNVERALFPHDFIVRLARLAEKADRRSRKCPRDMFLHAGLSPRSGQSANKA